MCIRDSFSAADTMSFSAGGTAQFTMADGVIAPVTDSDVDLGTSSLFFKDAFIDTIVIKDTGTIGSASDTDAMSISAGGVVNFTARPTFAASLTIQDGGSIGSTNDLNAVTISAGGVVAVTATTESTSATSGALTVAGGVGIAKDLSVGDDLRLISEDAVLSFGEDSDVTITHDPDDGLFFKSVATGPSNPFLLTIQTGETGIGINDVLGKIQFQAPEGGGGGAAQTIAAAIRARASAAFASDANETALDFMTGAGEAASTRMIVDHNLITAVEPINITDSTASTSSTTGSLIVGGGVGIAADLFVGDDFDVTGDAVIDGTALVTGILTTTGTNVFNGGFDSNANCSISPDAADKRTFFFTSNAQNDASLFMKSNTTNKVNIQANGTSFLNGGDFHWRKTAVAFGTGGVSFINSISHSTFTRDQGTPVSINRTGNAGSCIDLFQAGNPAGIFGVNANDPFIARPNGNGLRFFNTGMVPCNSAGANADNSVSLGLSGARFDDAFITNGVTTGSDRTDKQDIAALTSTEMLVAARISKTFHTYRWKDAVVDKGDDARIHTGTIAQEVQAAFTAEGLDAGNYAMFMSDTWWEHDVDVAAVEASDAVDAVYREVTDSDGLAANEVVTESKQAIEAADAYTRTDSYYTEDAAPTGSTSKTRLGIRYPELLSFLAAYNEQRFASIETRLTALEG